MADDEKPRRKRRESDDEAGSDGRQRRRSSGGRVSGARLAALAREQMAEITGLEAESVSSLEPLEDGTWRVTVELLELSRIPETDDMLGSYEADFDEDGELLGYRRVRRYPRSLAGEIQGVPGGK